MASRHRKRLYTIYGCFVLLHKTIFKEAYSFPLYKTFGWFYSYGTLSAIWKGIYSGTGKRKKEFHADSCFSPSRFHRQIFFTGHKAIMNSKQPGELDATIIRLLNQAGYIKPTPLQEKVIPIILKGKDIAVEAGEKTGKTASFVLPLLTMIGQTGNGTRAIVISSSLDHSMKYVREFRKFTRQKSFAFSVVLLGDETGRRDEYRALSKGPDIVVGTSKTIIDHIRRGNFSFESLASVVIDVPGPESIEGFEQDIQFILHKMPEKRQTLLYSPIPLSKIEGLLSILKRPVIVAAKDWMFAKVHPKITFYDTDGIGAREKLLIVRDCLLAKSISSIIIFCHRKPTAAELCVILAKHGFKPKLYSHDRTEAEKAEILKAFNNEKIDVIVSTQPSILNERYLAPDRVLYFDLPEKIEEYIEGLFTGSQKTREVLSFVSNDEYQKIIQSEEIAKMEPIMENLPTEEEMMSGYAKKILKGITEDGDEADLGRYVRIIRKSVSFFSRSTFAAFLFRELYGKKIGVKPSKGTTLFISIGKNRKVFPQDLIQLFTTTLDIKKTDIKEIKILDNYSFIDIAPQHSDKAIKKLDGIEFKGKKITVNFARKKEPRSRPR
jgi:ATP-dependent RNA helicase DeaD